MFTSESFWDVSLKDFEKGYYFDETDNRYVCLSCGKGFENGIIYNIEGTLCVAEKAVSMHFRMEHGNVFENLINMDKKYTGISEVQKEILLSFYHGKSDDEISAELGTAKSTIRNHRFRLKEKSKQAKIFLTLMNMVESHTRESDRMIPIHRNAKMIDERYAITQGERDKIIEKLFNKDGVLRKFPSEESEKIVILTEVIKRFTIGETYSEKEINEIIKEVFADYAMIRRDLITYGFIDRKQDGSAYWVVF